MTNALPTGMEGEGFMACIANSHQRAIKIFGLSFFMKMSISQWLIVKVTYYSVIDSSLSIFELLTYMHC